MRINVNNARLPGITSEHIGPDTVSVWKDDQYIGSVTYASRRRKAPAGSASSTGFVTDYGWKPTGPGNFALSSKVEAIRKLPEYKEGS